MTRAPAPSMQNRTAHKINLSTTHRKLAVDGSAGGIGELDQHPVVQRHVSAMIHGQLRDVPTQIIGPKNCPLALAVAARKPDMGPLDRSPIPRDCLDCITDLHQGSGHGL